GPRGRRRRRVHGRAGPRPRRPAEIGVRLAGGDPSERGRLSRRGGRSPGLGLGSGMSGPSRPAAVLVGPPGAGKTTIGRKLARRRGVAVRDSDQLIEVRWGLSIPEIFASDGEAGFREIEQESVGEMLAGFDGVLSLGGGAVLSAVTRERLRGTRVIHMTIGVAEGVRRSRVS